MSHASYSLIISSSLKSSSQMISTFDAKSFKRYMIPLLEDIQELATLGILYSTSMKDQNLESSLRNTLKDAADVKNRKPTCHNEKPLSNDSTQQ